MQPLIDLAILTALGLVAWAFLHHIDTADTKVAKFFRRSK